MIAVAGRRLIEHALLAASARDPIIVVGDPLDLGDGGIRWVREEPRYGGPASALAAGIRCLDPDDGSEVLVLACDLPEAAALVRALDAEPLRSDALVAVDGDGREQWLAARYRLGPLRRAAESITVDGASMRMLVRGLSAAFVTVGAEAADLDTWTAIEEYRRAHPADDQEHR